MRSLLINFLVLFDHRVQRLDFIVDGFSIVLALVRRVKAWSGCIRCTAKAFSEGGAFHRLNLRDAVDAEGNQDEE